MSLTQALDDFENILEKEIASHENECDRLDKEIEKFVKRKRFDGELFELEERRLRALEMMYEAAMAGASPALALANGHEELSRVSVALQKLHDYVRQDIKRRAQKRSSPQQMASP